METLFKHLLVKAGTVETGGHGEFDIALECRIAGSGPDAVGIESLIQHQTLVEGLVVQINLVAFHMNLAHSHVRVHHVCNLAFAVLHLIHHIIEEGRRGAPQLGVLDGKHHTGSVMSGNGLGGHHLFAVLHGNGKGSLGLSIELGLHHDELLVNVGGYLGTFQSVLCHGFHPNRLPNTGGAGVHTLEGFVAHVLLAGGLLGCAGVAIGVNHQRVGLAVGDKLCYVNGKGCASAEVASGQLAVNVHLRVVIHRTEVQLHVASGPSLGHGDAALVPDVVDEVLVLHTGKFAFGAEGHGNLSVEALALIEFAFQTGANEIEGIAPLAIQVYPVLSLELRTGILGPWLGLRTGNQRKDHCKN